MLHRNNIWLGIVLGLLVPFVGYAVLMLIIEQIQAAELFNLPPGPIFQQRTVLLMAICLNLIPFNVFQRQRKAKSMRGVLSSTLVLSAVWLYYFGSSIMQES